MTSRIAVFGFAIVGTLAFASGSAFATGKTVEGRIVSYECGDNCYLTLRTDAGKTIVAMCYVGLCEKWVDAAEMPTSFVGRRVGGKIGVGTRVDGAYNKLDQFPNFETLTAK